MEYRFILSKPVKMNKKKEIAQMAVFFGNSYRRRRPRQAAKVADEARRNLEVPRLKRRQVLFYYTSIIQARVIVEILLFITK